MIFFQITGLDLSLNINSRVPPRAGTFCGVLTCDETAGTSQSSGLNTSHSDSDIAFNNISSMSIFKRIPKSSQAFESSRRDFLVASLTSQQPKITRVSNDGKVSGLLETERATLQMDLVKPEDCQSEFSCQVRGLDRDGREVVNTATLLPQPHRIGQHIPDGGQLPVASVNLLASIQQVVMQSVECLKDKVEQWQSDFNSELRNIVGQIGQIQKDLDNRSNSVEKRIDGRLLLLENRIYDKIDRSNNLNQPVQINLEVSSDLADKIRQEVGSGLEKTLKNVSETFEQNFKNASALLQSMATDVDQLKTYGDVNVLALRNQTETLRELTDSDNSFTRRVYNDILASDQSLVDKFGVLETNIQNYFNNTVTELKDYISAEKFESVMRHDAPRSCRMGMGAGVSQNLCPYRLMYNNGESGVPFRFLCDIATEGGGWIVIQRRVSGYTDFNRNWNDYKEGFGSFETDFWLGNEKIHSLTESGTYELRVEVTYGNETKIAHYSEFHVASEHSKYQLKVGSYRGTAGDSLRNNCGMKFTTADSDNDLAGSANCATNYNGGWWFRRCGYSNLNGKWGSGQWRLFWNPWTEGQSASYSEMKIRLLD